MQIAILNLSKDRHVNSKSEMLFECDNCHLQSKRSIKNHTKICNNELSCGKDLCKKCWTKILNNRESYKQKMRERLKIVTADPEWRQRNSESKLGKINIGEKNGMKNPIARKKVSETRKKLLSSTEQREKISEYTRKAWSDGKYDGVKVGKCKWFTHIRPDGVTCKVQGTWELAYARYLDAQNITYETHKDRVGYVDEHGVNRKYFPDFKLNDQHYVEIKNDFHLSLQPLKLELVKQQNPNIKFELLLKDDLIALGVQL